MLNMYIAYCQKLYIQHCHFLYILSLLITKGLYMDYFQSEPREFIDLLTYCRGQMVSQEKLEESLKRLLGTGCKGVSVEKLRALLGNKPCVNPTREPEDKISIKAKDRKSVV